MLCTVGVTAASAVSLAAFGTGVASADDYAGQKYSDASSAISDAGDKAVIATRAGDELDDDNCVVTHSQKAAWLKGDDFAPVTDTILLNLNCDAPVASAKAAGNSVASPEGKAALKEQRDEAAKAAADKADSAK